MRHAWAMALWAVATASAAGCGEPRDDDAPEGEAHLLADAMDAGLAPRTASDPGIDGGAGGGRRDPLPCSDLFDPSRLQTFEVQLSDAELQKLTDEFLRPEQDTDGSGLRHPWHPIVFKLGAETRTDAMLRLKGDSSWLDTVRLDRNPKAQFVIAFDRIDKKARFHGLSKLELDMPRSDPTFLRERVGHHIMRDLGLPGVCSTSVRLDVNGKYYGLYAAQEDMGKELLRRLYPGASQGALWKSGEELETDETPEVLARQDAWMKATDIASMRRIIDLEQALEVWAAEIVMNNADGYYGGNHNFYTYDHPSRGFLWIPTDLDSTFDYLDADIHPIYWWEQHDGDQTAGHHFRAVINDPVWRARLVNAVERVVRRWDVPGYQARVSAWAQQIAGAVRDDPHRPTTLTRVAEATGWMRDTIQWRPDWLKPWIECERSNVGADFDRDGAPWCKDCNDRSAAQRPGAREVCGNRRDDDCDGLKDEDCIGGPPSSGAVPRRPRWPWSPRTPTTPTAPATPTAPIAPIAPADAGTTVTVPLRDAGVVGPAAPPRDAGATGVAPPLRDAGVSAPAAPARDAGIRRAPWLPGRARDAGTPSDGGTRRWPGLFPVR